MVTIHYGERNVLRDREMFPFAFGMLGSNFVTIQAFTKLMIRNNWTKIILLYSEVDIDLNEVSLGIEKNIMDTPGFDTAFTSPIYDSFIPLQEIKQSFARVIFVLLSAEATLRTLCLAFHEGMIFPKYQWVFKERFENDFTEIAFSYQGKRYFCSEEDISTILYGSINLVWSLDSDDTTSVAYEEGYAKQRNLYTNAYNVRSTSVEWARGMHDAVWSLAFALNGSLRELNMNITQIIPGSKTLAQAIANHMSEIDFQGVSGRIDFDKETGFNTARQVNIHQFGEAKSCTLIGFYASKELVILDKLNATPLFIDATFDMREERVSVALAVSFLIISIAILLIAVPIQVINIIYRKHSSIKATSPNLNHLIFVGCYLTVVGMVLSIITEIWRNARMYPLIFCDVSDLLVDVGTSMIIGTACLKTWRLYRIYIASKRVLRLHPKAMTDTVLGVAVGALAFFDLLVCLLWTGIDPQRSQAVTRIETSHESDLPVIVTTAVCRSKWPMYWVGVLIGYKCVLIGCSTVLAMLTKIKKEEFQTRNIVILAYLFAITYGLGVPIYTVLAVIGVHVSVFFVLMCVVINMITYIQLLVCVVSSICYSLN